MGRYCSTEEGVCDALCDFCKNFEEDNSNPEYDGFCKVLNEPVDRLSFCEEHFVCFRIDE